MPEAVKPSKEWLNALEENELDTTLLAKNEFYIDVPEKMVGLETYIARYSDLVGVCYVIGYSKPLPNRDGEENTINPEASALYDAIHTKLEAISDDFRDRTPTDIIVASHFALGEHDLQLAKMTLDKGRHSVVAVVWGSPIADACISE